MEIYQFLLIYAVGFIAIMYLVTIVPAKRKNKKMQAMHASIAVGDQVSTVGGIVGTVVSRDETMVTLLTDNKLGVTTTFVVQAIQNILEKADDTQS